MVLGLLRHKAWFEFFPFNLLLVFLLIGVVLGVVFGLLALVGGSYLWVTQKFPLVRKLLQPVVKVLGAVLMGGLMFLSCIGSCMPAERHDDKPRAKDDAANCRGHYEDNEPYQLCRALEQLIAATKRKEEGSITNEEFRAAQERAEKTLTDEKYEGEDEED